MSFGKGKTLRYLDATHMARKLGNDKCDALPAFHALTGCDTTSGFAGTGKRTVVQGCYARSTYTCPNTTIERFVILMYDKEIPDDSVNKAKQTLFTQKGREIENIPPTKDALRQHVLRAAYQAGHMWGQALLKAPQLPSPEEFVWKQENASAQWKVKWTNLPPTGAVCRAVVKCGCVKGCRRRCKYVQENLPCTLLCKCGGYQNHG